MIRIKYNGHEKQLQLAVGSVNSLFMDYRFYEKISQHSHFDLTETTPLVLSQLIKKANIEISIDFYYSILPFSNGMIYDDTENPFVIWLNKWNLNKPIDFLCNAIMHQCVHAVNMLHPHLSFGHGDNNPAGKENTAPYWIACLAQKMFLSDDSQPCDYILHEDILNIPKRMMQAC